MFIVHWHHFFQSQWLYFLSSSIQSPALSADCLSGPFEIWVTRNIMQSCQEQTQSGWLVLEVKFMYRTFIHMLLKLKSYFTFLLLLHAPRFYIFLLGIVSRPSAASIEC